MFKKTMKFDDLEGNEVEQTFYFNYNKKEIGELLSFGYISDFPPQNGEKRLPLEEQLEILKTPTSESGLTEQENTQQAYDIFQNLILDAFGEKGADNVTFVKNQRTREYFRNHVAFVELIFEFLEKPELAASFFENCLPVKLVARAKEELQAEAKGRLSSSTITEMVQEAARRQENPETRIEPGMEAAIEAGVATPPTGYIKPEHMEDSPIVTDGLSDEEILAKKPTELSKPQLLRAFELKSGQNITE